MTKVTATTQQTLTLQIALCISYMPPNGQVHAPETMSCIPLRYLSSTLSSLYTHLHTAHITLPKQGKHRSHRRMRSAGKQTLCSAATSQP